jgi:hypothetical protein
MVNHNSQNNNAQNGTILDPTMNPNSVYYLHPSDSGQKLVNIVFSGSGFLDWKRVMVISLSGKNKLGFVDGSLTRPTQNSASGKVWDRVNNVVMGWIIVVLYDSIVWVELGERYGQSSNA